MSDQAVALAVRDDNALSFSFTPQAQQLKEAALAAGALVGRVTNAEEQRAAVTAQLEVAKLLKAIEAARVAAKAPVIDFGRTIDTNVKRFITELKEEELRLARMVADFQQLEEMKVREAAKAENERLLQLERERAAELAKVHSHEEAEAIQERYQQRVIDESVAVAPTRVEGQRVSREWSITVTDIWLLAKAHPTCVKIEPRLQEIKSLLDAGVKVAGVVAEKVTQARVTTGRSTKAIEV